MNCKSVNPENHGMSHTPEYGAWYSMCRRCNNPSNHNFKNYGGRGIRVCEEWVSSFLSFLSDMGPRPSKQHSLGRKDNNGHYCPDNCAWETVEEQQRNKRSTRLIEFRGETRCVTEWAQVLGMEPHVIFLRLDVLGWKPEDALTAPPRVNVKLTPDDVLEIRRLRAAGVGAVQLAGQFSVDHTHIRRIVNRQMWPNL